MFWAYWQVYRVSLEGGVVGPYDYSKKEINMVNFKINFVFDIFQIILKFVYVFNNT